MNKYQDMLPLPHPEPKRRQRMARQDRAAQFAPFAALTGYDGAILEAGRLTQDCPVLASEAIQELDQALQAVARRLPRPCPVRLTWFQPDERKAGGAVLTQEAVIKKLDLYAGVLVLLDGREVPLPSLLALTLTDE